MRRSRILALSVLATFGSLAPVFAGEVYVPLASNRTVDGTVYRTKVWVSNPTPVPRRFSATFYEQGTDGTLSNGTPSSLTIPASGTLLLSSVAPEGKFGMLEISGAPQLTVTARVEAIGGVSVIASSAHVPVVSRANVQAANATAHLQGLEKTARGTDTDFGLMNLTRQPAQCTVRAFRATSGQIGQTAILSLFPLSHVQFDRALVSLGENNISDARFEVSCDKQFFAYAMVFKPGGPETVFVTPSSALDGDLVPGGGGGGGSAPGAVTFQAQGTFLNARQGASFVQFDLPLQPGQRYRKATIEFDLASGRFPGGLFAGITALRRTDRTLFYGLIVRGDREKTLLDMGVDDDIVQGSNNGPWRERTNYHVKFEYDTVAGTLVFTLFKNNTQVERLTGRINHFDLNPNDRVIRVDFGQTGIADGAYFPPLGWQYSNLNAVFEPAD